ncbi:MAG: CDP-alcohol phosphatidyltransferase family protein [Candidatus Omnitrophica bacterium]|nr:CDP-alcohol phosphatidyltransferase family protein [Candidatus Omnitrophota bacterium]
MTLANKITSIRIMLTPFFILALINYSPQKDFLRFIALGIFAVSAFTDFLDGYVARRFNQETASGRVLDVVADKIFLITAFVLLSLLLKLPLNVPVWVAVVIIGRDAVVILSIFIFHIITKRLYILPDITGKLSIAVEMLVIIAVLLNFKHSFVIWNLAVALACLSGIKYLVSGIRLVKKEKVSA